MGRRQHEGIEMYDLLLKGGEIVNPSQKLRAVGDVAFEGGRMAKVGRSFKPILTVKAGKRWLAN